MMGVDWVVQVNNMHYAERLEASRRAQWIRQMRKPQKGEWRWNPAGLLWTGAVLLAAIRLLA